MRNIKNYIETIKCLLDIINKIYYNKTISYIKSLKL